MERRVGWIDSGLVELKEDGWMDGWIVVFVGLKEDGELDGWLVSLLDG